MESSDNKPLVIIGVVVLILLGLATWAGSCMGKSQVMKSYEDTKTQLASVQSELSKSQTTSANLQKDKDALQLQVQSLQNDLSGARVASAALQRDNAALNSQLASVQFELSKSQSTSAGLQNDKDANLLQIQSLQSDLSGARAASASLQRDNTALRSQLASVQSELSQGKSQYSNLQNTSNELRSQLSSANAQLSRVQTIQTTLQAVQQENSSLKAQVASWLAWMSNSPVPSSTLAASGTRITASPSSGPVGTAVTLTGSGFTVNTTGNIFLDINHNGISDAGELAQSVTTSSSGAFSTTMIVPSIPPGSYQMLVTGFAGMSIQTSPGFTVTASSTSGPNIIVNPVSAPAGSVINISGSGFADDVSGWVFIDINRNNMNDSGDSYQIVQTSSKGSFSASLNVPSSSLMPPGTYSVMVIIPAGQAPQALATFNLTGG